MRKVLLSVFVAVLMLSFAGLSYAAVSSVYEVAVVGMQGDVKVDTKGDGTWITPWSGMKLKKNSVIKTGSGSFVDIVYDAEGLNLVRVKANTEITVEKAQVVMPDGEVLVKFANLTPGSTFTVKTPTAACGIRGSGMGVGFDRATGTTTCNAFEHNAFMQGLDASGNPVGQEQTVRQGTRAGAGRGGAVQQQGSIPASAQAGFNSFVAGTTGTGTGTGDAEAEAATADADQVDTKDLDEEKEISPSS